MKDIHELPEEERKSLLARLPQESEYRKVRNNLLFVSVACVVMLAVAGWLVMAGKADMTLAIIIIIQVVITYLVAMHRFRSRRKQILARWMSGDDERVATRQAMRGASKAEKKAMKKQRRSAD